MEMVATNLGAITVVVTNSSDETTSETVSSIYLLVVYKIYIYQDVLIIWTDFFLQTIENRNECNLSVFMEECYISPKLR